MSVRIHPYISELNHARLSALATRPRQSISTIVDTALEAYFTSSPDSLGGHAILRRLDRLTRQFDRLEQKDLVLGETLALFVRYFMMITPPVPADRQDAARAAGDLRFETFIDQLGIELQAGRRLLQRAIDQVLLDESDLFTSAELDKLHVPAPERDGSAADA
jgi:hypothetical protein